MLGNGHMRDRSRSRSPSPQGKGHFELGSAHQRDVKAQSNGRHPQQPRQLKEAVLKVTSSIFGAEASHAPASGDDRVLLLSEGESSDAAGPTFEGAAPWQWCC